MRENLNYKPITVYGVRVGDSGAGMATTRSERGGPDPIDVMVGLRLRDFRKAKGYSQSDLAVKLGVTFQQVQKYERGANRISASMLVKAAKAIGVSPGQLLPEGQARRRRTDGRLRPHPAAPAHRASALRQEPGHARRGRQGELISFREPLPRRRLGYL
jgi:transcriptional regulator with XRE-family HTH domain